MWDKIKRAAQNDLYRGVFSKQQPSVIGNVLLGNPANQGIATYGGKEAAKMQYKMQKVGPIMGQPKVTPTPTSVPLPKAIKVAPTKVPKAPGIGTKIISPLGKDGLNIRVKAKAPPPVPTPVPDNFESRMMGTADEQKIPREVFFGIAAAENGKINKFNLGAVDSNPGKAVKFDSDLAAATSAAKFLKGEMNTEFYGNKEEGKKQFTDAYKYRKDPSKYLQAIRDAGYAGDPATWKQRSVDAKGAGLHFDTWDEFVKNTPAYKKWSKK